MADSISSLSDTELLAMSLVFHDAIALSPPSYGLTVAQATALNDARTEFSDALDEHNSKQAAAQAATANKNAERGDLINILRSYRTIAKGFGASEALMAALGLPASGEAAPASGTVPVAQVDTSERLRHTISWIEAAGGGNKKRPRGIMGAEIWVKIDGPPPGSEADCTFLGLDSATPYVMEYDAAEGGKTAHYMLRWVNRDGTKGAWGETVSATITA